MTPLAIFMASNDAYACFAATAMMSIAEHTESPVHFHLFDDGIRPARRRKIARAIAGHRHATLTLHVDLDRRLDACVNDWYRTRAIFARYFIADRFPEHAMSLYVDVDTIFLDDVAELFALGTGDHGLAACHDMALHKMVDVERHKSRLGIAPEHDYFNNGMILIDGPFWRRNQLSEQLTQTAIEHRGRVTFPSQDPMNIAFAPNRCGRCRSDGT
jgi:UDP-glucose/galactose:(glucosyl)LPS alpha-1,2-glucosyl/galactosyltransferase/UDP-glucose:(galactosyl)LPS alpha-1,2-glucosyltransferase/(galactosyl)LPS 1,2-glucosyltransferase